MKDSYFGDINDYYKYGLIRIITVHAELTSSICWMLTKDEGSRDGRKLKYLMNPSKWSGFDPELFSELRNIVVDEQNRGFRYARERNLIPSASYFEEYLSDDLQARTKYMESFMHLSSSAKLLFFDPDNGMEVASVRLGRKGSSKYLYWEELDAFSPRDASILIYQHFPRVERQRFIDQQANRFLSETEYSHVMSFRTANVVFFLLIAHEYAGNSEGWASAVKTGWGDEFRIGRHSDA